MSTEKQEITFPNLSRPAIPEKLNTPDIIHLTARLAQLLAEEVDLLSAMEIRKIGELQQEKLFLTNALEAHRRQLLKYPKLKDTMSASERGDLEAVVKVFEDILGENQRRLSVAREANQRIVKTITNVVKDSAMSQVYDDRGVRGGLGGEALSITLNQTA